MPFRGNEWMPNVHTLEPSQAARDPARRLGLDGRVSDARVRPRLSTPLLAVVLCLVWSSAFIFVKLALRDAPAEVFAALRSVAAAPALFAALLLLVAAGLGRALLDRRVT